MKVMITGGASDIGRNLAARPLACGAQPVLLDVVAPGAPPPSSGNRLKVVTGAVAGRVTTAGAA